MILCSSVGGEGSVAARHEGLLHGGTDGFRLALCKRTESSARPERLWSQLAHADGDVWS